MKLKKSNTTGIEGVCKTGGYYRAYIFYNSTQTKQKKFSILKYGEAEALRLAIAYRRKIELEIIGSTVIPDYMIEKTEYHQQAIEAAKQFRELKSQAVSNQRAEKEKLFNQRKELLRQKAEKYLYRFDGRDKGHGWLLLIEINGTVLYQHTFRDSVYGSIELAFDAAKKERKNQLKKHNLIFAKGRRYQHNPRSTNKTGITGVCKSCGSYHTYITVQPGKTLRKKFSVKKYGDEQAFDLAREWRREMEIQVY